MKASQITTNITFLKKETPSAPDGSRLARTDWVYDVDGQTVWVETDYNLPHDWHVADVNPEARSKVGAEEQESQIKEACKIFIRNKIENGRWSPSPESNRLTLNGRELEDVAKGLGWKPRH